MEMEEDFNKWKKSLEQDFNKWQSGFIMNFKWENPQPYYFDKVKRDPVREELERQDRLETVVDSLDTAWVEVLCSELQRK